LIPFRPGHQFPPRLALGLALACSLGAGLAGGPALAATSYSPQPSSDATVVGIGGKDYYLLGEEPLVLPLVGPGTLSGYARAGFAPDDRESKAGSVTLAGLGDRVIRIPFTFTASESAAWDDGRPGRPSAGRKFEIFVPAGVWTLHLTGSLPAGGPLVAILYYDGPPQSEFQARQAKAARQSPWTYRNRFGLEMIYTDNVLTMSEDGVDAWVAGVDPEQFLIGKYDDLVVAPTLDFSAQRKLLGWGDTRFRFKVKRWMYTQNPIKTNTDFDGYVRQFFSGGKSLELYLHYAPEQYIRQLSDRPPYSDPDAPIEYKEFRFTRNIINLTWRQRLNRTWDYTLIVENNRRYYNKPFIENDTVCYECRLSVGCRVAKPLKLSGDYSVEFAESRAYDSLDETPATSDDGDASYNRDLYRLGFDLATPWAMPVFDSIDGSYLFMDYYYTTDRDLFDDPYHVGRRDKMQKVGVSVNRKITKTLSVYASFRYSDRVVESPWYGDITIDKDFIEHRYWVGMDYSF